jgi:hypothetical protein
MNKGRGREEVGFRVLQGINTQKKVEKELRSN